MNTRLLALLSVVVLTGCPQPTPLMLPAPPSITTFTASPTTAAPGSTVTLSWETAAATTVSIVELGGGTLAGVDDRASGSLEVTVGTDDAYYVLTAENARGVRASSLASVRVDGAGEELLFVALPPELPATGTTTLVWSARGARTVTLTANGAAVDLQGQLNSGSLVVDPAGAEVTYTLTADGQSKSLVVTRSQAITTFTVTPLDARAGQTITAAWTTTAASRVRLTSPSFGTIADVTDAASVASGSATWTLPLVDGPVGLPLVLTAEGRGAPVERVITLYPSDAPVMLTATAPRYVRAGAQFTLSWTSRGADLVRVSSGGATVYEGAANGSVTLPSPAAEATYELVAVRPVSNRVSAPRSVIVAPVGVPTLVDFSANPTSIATGGTPVTLSWNVTNARNLRIRELGGPVVHQLSGASASTGTLVVYPNRATTRYELEADNLADQFVTPTEVSITVATPARLTFDTLRPVGTTARITGSTLGTGTLTRVPVARTSATDTFVDISLDGTPITFASTDTAAALVDVGDFFTQLFDVPVSNVRLSVSTNGWMFFSPTSVAGPATPAAAIGTTLQPLALAVFYGDLDVAPGRVYWRIDTANGERRLIVQWTNVTDGSATPSADLTFQAQVYESGRVVYAYESLVGFTGNLNAGIVNAAETAVLLAPATPTSGAVFSFFGDATLPEAVPVIDGPVTAAVRLPMGLLRLEGDPRLAPGLLAITEANPRPGVDGGEWVEVTNASPVALDLGGYELRVDGGVRVTIPGPLLVPAGGRAVLAAEPLANDGVTVSGTYGAGLTALHSALTLATEGVTISRVDLTMPDAGLGRSVRADPPTANMKFPNTTITQLTCPDGQNAYGTNGQFGTPGAVQGRCFPYVLERDAGVPFQSIAPTGTLIIAGSSAQADDSVTAVTLTRPVRVGGVNRSTLYVSTNGFIAPSAVAPTGTNKTTPSATAPSGGIIAPYWDELDGQAGTAGSGIYWQEFDPNSTPGDGDEYTLVSWERWRVDSTTQNDLNFQVRFSANGDVSYHYGTMTAAGTSAIASGSSATVWLEDPLGRAALVQSASTSGSITTGLSLRFVSSP
jgi:hypothetical protein